MSTESSAHKMTVMQQGLCWGRTTTSRVRGMGCISALGGGGHGEYICWWEKLLDSLSQFVGRERSFIWWFSAPQSLSKWYDMKQFKCSDELSCSRFPWQRFILQQLTCQTVIQQVIQVCHTSIKLLNFHFLILVFSRRMYYIEGWLWTLLKCSWFA